MAQDYYQILGVSEDADAQTIKRAYRELVKRYHPDRNPPVGSEEKFHKIQEAYEVLSDPKERQKYDKQRERGAFQPDGDWFQQLREIVYRHTVRKEKRKRKHERIKQKEQQLFRYALKVLFAPAALVILLILGVYFYTNYQQSYRLEHQGETTVATVYLVSEGWIGPAYAFYSFRIDGQQIRGSRQLSLRANALPVGDNGMPVQRGDQYKLRYVPQNPDNNKLLLQEPTDQQVKRYHQMAKDRCVMNNRKDAESIRMVAKYCNCKLEKLYQEFGVESYAYVYFREEKYLNNATHNRKSFRKFSKRPEYQRADRHCREQHLER